MAFRSAAVGTGVGVGVVGVFIVGFDAGLEVDALVFAAWGFEVAALDVVAGEFGVGIRLVVARVVCFVFACFRRGPGRRAC